MAPFLQTKKNIINNHHNKVYHYSESARIITEVLEKKKKITRSFKVKYSIMKLTGIKFSSLSAKKIQDYTDDI